MFIRIAILAAIASLTFAGSAKAENILCPPQDQTDERLGKWTGDYYGSLGEVSLSRQFVGDQEGAIIRCKRTIGSVHIMFQKRSCRIVPAGGKTEYTPYASMENVSCTIPLDLQTDT